MADRFDKFTERARRGFTLGPEERERFKHNYICTEPPAEEARPLNHSYIGTEPLLLGLVREGEGIAFGVLESLGVSLERVRTETARILSQSTPQSTGTGGRTATRTPTVDQLGIDLTAASRAGKLDPGIGRGRRA